MHEIIAILPNPPRPAAGRRKERRPVPYNPFNAPRRKSAARVTRGRALAAALPRGPGGRFLPSGRNPWARITYPKRTARLWRAEKSGRFDFAPPPGPAVARAKPKKKKAKKAPSKAVAKSIARHAKKAAKKKRALPKAANFGYPLANRPRLPRRRPKRRNPDEGGFRALATTENAISAVTGVLGAGAALGLPRLVAKYANVPEWGMGWRGGVVAAGGVVVPSLVLGLVRPKLARGYFVGGLIGLGLRVLLWLLKGDKARASSFRSTTRPSTKAAVRGATGTGAVVSEERMIAEESAMQGVGVPAEAFAQIELDGMGDDDLDGMGDDEDGVGEIELEPGSVPAFTPAANETF